MRLAKDKVETERLVNQLKKKLDHEHARVIETEKNIESMETALAFQVKQRKELLDLVRDQVAPLKNIKQQVDSSRTE